MFDLLLGHLVGDYLLQNEYMAHNKSKAGWQGWVAAIIHCVVYTLAVCTIMWNFDPIWMVAVFFSHLPIDRYALAEKYMHYIKGSGLKDFLDKGDYNKPDRLDALVAGFASLVYVVTDNTMHLLLMWGCYQLIY